MPLHSLSVPVGSLRKDISELRSFANSNAANGSGYVAIYHSGDHYSANGEPATADQFRRLIYRAKQELN